MKPLALLIAVAAIAIGLVCSDDHYRLRQVGQPSDQAVLDHRDSSYTSMTWVGSPSENYLQLRFFDKVEGGLGLRPTWAELNQLAAKDPRLAHLRYETSSGSVAPWPTWPGEAPDPGTLPNSAYVRFFPVGVLLNNQLMAKAGGDLRAADPHVLVIGLGSSAGILVLAHHFPNAAITVVDIDQHVINVVHDHVPLTRWLETQKTADGSPRLRLIAKDARQFVRFDAIRDGQAGRAYDLIILDAYTAGSTIPSHLMTREFFAECAAAMAPDGLVLGNIIGSYSGDKRKVVGGCLRSLRAGGLVEAYNIPVVQDGAPGYADFSKPRNNIVLASRKPIDPKRSPAAWQRLLEFVPFPELAIGRYVTTQYMLLDEGRGLVSSALPGAAIDEVDPAIQLKLKAENPQAGAPQHQHVSIGDDTQLIASARTHAAAWYAKHREPDKLVGPPLGWADATAARYLYRRETDWVKAAREVWRVSLNAARDGATHGGEALVGPVDGPERESATANWTIGDAPLFTDQMPNADIVNH